MQFGQKNYFTWDGECQKLTNKGGKKWRWTQVCSSSFIPEGGYGPATNCSNTNRVMVYVKINVLPLGF
jgi:hypothetical protein